MNIKFYNYNGDNDYIEYLTGGIKECKEGYDITDKSRNSHVDIKFIPYGENRAGILQEIRYIVIHEVSLGLGRTTPDRNFEYYYNKLLTDESGVAYHYLCDDNMVYEFVPDFEKIGHTGTMFNRRSIGVERLVNENVSFPDALYNQAKVVASLMYKWGIPLDNVITHSRTRELANKPPKDCPSRMNAGQYGGIELFKKVVVNCLRNKDFFNDIINTDIMIVDNNKKRR